jgi:hypothetical protein
VLVQALVPKPADEALHESVLDRHAGLDETQPHAGSRRPGEQGAAGEFRPVSHDDLRRQAVSARELDEQAYDLRAADGWSVAAAAVAFEISPPTMRKWLARFRSEGDDGLQNRCSAPHLVTNMLKSDLYQMMLQGPLTAFGQRVGGSALPPPTPFCPGPKPFLQTGPGRESAITS